MSFEHLPPWEALLRRRRGIRTDQIARRETHDREVRRIVHHLPPTRPAHTIQMISKEGIAS